MMDKLYKDLKSSIESVEQFKPARRLAKLGYVYKGVYRIVDPDDNRFYFARFPDGGFVRARHYGKVSPVPDADVYVMRDNAGLYITTDVYGEGSGPNTGGTASVGYHHHKRGTALEYEIDSWLVTGMRVILSLGLILTVGGGVYWNANGEIRQFIETTLDVTAYVPTTSSRHCWIVIYLDAETEELNVSVGSELSTFVPLSFTNLPTVDRDGINLCAVELTTDMTEINEDLIVDLRFPLYANKPLHVAAAVAETIASGEIDMPYNSAFVELNAESGTSDDLDTITITGMPRLFLVKAASGDTITLKHGTGNIEFNDELDKTVSGNQSLLLFWDGSYVTDVYVVNNANRRYIAPYNYRPSGGSYPQIGLATSSNGRDFVRISEPIFSLGTSGQFDDDHQAHPCLVQVDGVLYMYYGGYDGSNYSVGLARSFDGGDTWTKYGQVMAASQAWESSTVSWARVLYDEKETNSAKRWKMWYTGGASGVGGIGYAYSADGLTWTKYASNPVMSLGTSGAWDDAAINTGDVVRVGDTYYLFYSGLDSLITTTYGSGVTSFTNPESAYTNDGDPIIAGDGKTTTITSNVSIGDTTINVTDATVFPIGAAVWVYDGTGYYITHIEERVSSTAIRVSDSAPLAINSSGGNVRSIAYNSVNIVRAIYDGGWMFYCTGFQPGFNTSHVMETSFFAYADTLDNVIIDYGGGQIIRTLVSETTTTNVSFENPYAVDTLDWSKRLSSAGGGMINISFTASPTGIFNVSGSPADSTGTIALSMDTQSPNTVLAGDSSGGTTVPSFRALVVADLPLSDINVSELKTRYEPLTNGDSISPELVFYNGDVIMVEVDN